MDKDINILNALKKENVIINNLVPMIFYDSAYVVGNDAYMLKKLYINRCKDYYYFSEIKYSNIIDDVPNITLIWGSFFCQEYWLPQSGAIIINEKGKKSTTIENIFLKNNGVKVGAYFYYKFNCWIQDEKKH